ncbi:PAS-domain containing protein [Shimia sp. NS0008-38b]
MSQFGTVLLFVFLSAILLSVFVWVTYRHRYGPSSAPPPLSTSNEKALFLFRAGALVDANSTALQICSQAPAEVFDWTALRQCLTHSFPDFPLAQGASQGRDTLILQSQDPTVSTILTLDQWDDVARITIEKNNVPDAARRTAVMQAMFQAPSPVWKENMVGTVVWRNAAYKDLAEKMGFPAKGAQLFDVRDLTPGGTPVRLCVKSNKDDISRWFDVTAVQISENVMYYATAADAVVSAIHAQRNFVQTFSKTFAQLSTGLAIFDQTRKLAIFNPALTELTQLNADFLSNHCDISDFFDQLREHQLVPSPVSHVYWRDQIESVIQLAMTGQYSQSWTFPSGVTYRVTGRPHPDGALAFLFEDITAELTVTRRFRTEIDQCHSVLDTVKSALVLFGPNGKLHLCNKAYRDLWKSDPDSSFAEYTLRDALVHWEDDCLPNDVWQNLRERVLSTIDRNSWHATVTKKTLEGLRLSVSPVAGGMTLVAFDQILPFHTSVRAPMEFHHEV